MTDIFDLLCLVGTMLQPVLAIDRDSEINLHSNTWMWRLQHRLWNCNMCNNRQVTSNIQHVSNFKFWSIVSLHVLTAFLTYLLTYLLHGAEFFKLTGFHPVKKFPAVYGTWRFIIAFTSVRHLSLSCACSIQSSPICSAQKGKGGVCTSKQASVWRTLPSEWVYFEGR